MPASLDDLIAFRAVARELNFTRAAAQMGVSQSALSKTVRELEVRLGVRLLTRTTRSVSLTEAGQSLIEDIGPHLDAVAAGVANLSALRERPAGLVRITADERATTAFLWPALEPVLAQYPEIRLELTIDYGLTDIVAERYDAGVRSGEQVARDMISVPIGPPIRPAVIAAPAYFEGRKKPTTPQDLVGHSCINLRLPTAGGLYAWEFERGGREVRVRVEGQVILNTGSMMLQAALDGRGLAYMPEEQVAELLAAGRLVRVLEDWCEPFAGYHLYYPSRRQPTPAFRLVLDALRVQGARAHGYSEAVAAIVARALE